MKFGLEAETAAFLGLDLSGRLIVLAADDGFAKNDAMLFCPDADPAFLSVVGVEETGVADFLAMATKSTETFAAYNRKQSSQGCKCRI